MIIQLVHSHHDDDDDDEADCELIFKAAFSKIFIRHLFQGLLFFYRSILFSLLSPCKQSITNTLTRGKKSKDDCTAFTLRLSDLAKFVVC